MRQTSNACQRPAPKHCPQSADAPCSPCQNDVRGALIALARRRTNDEAHAASRGTCSKLTEHLGSSVCRTCIEEDVVRGIGRGFSEEHGDSPVVPISQRRAERWRSPQRRTRVLRQMRWVKGLAVRISNLGRFERYPRAFFRSVVNRFISRTTRWRGRVVDDGRVTLLTVDYHVTEHASASCGVLPPSRRSVGRCRCRAERSQAKQPRVAPAGHSGRRALV